MLHSDFYDENALFERLTTGVLQSGTEVVFLVGSALTAPRKDGDPGVPGVAGIIDLIRAEFGAEQQADFDKTVHGSINSYQAAFHFLLGRRSPQVANGIIRAAMAMARKSTATSGRVNTYRLSATTDESTCRAFDHDRAGWVLSEPVVALGEIVAKYPKRFGRTVLTTNFDPLVEVSISVAGGVQFRTVLHRDGNLGQSEGDGAHVIHLHGYWYGSDTLHTPRQLGQPRPLLKASLANLIRNKIVVVIGYGGWDDAFAEALAQVVADDSAFPEVVWTLFRKDHHLPEGLLHRLEPGLSRGRVTLYNGIDCHSFLPKLRDWWITNEKPAPSNLPVAVSVDIPASSFMSPVPTVRIEPTFTNEENPPRIDFYVGRSSDLLRLEETSFRFGFITGMGGQGKSALAAAYFVSQRRRQVAEFLLWRDCKEQSEKFEDQIARIIEGLSGGQSRASELASQPIESLALLFCNLTKDLRLLIVFDNVDHYVDLEKNKLIGAPDRFISACLSSKSAAKILFTCRPAIEYLDENVISHRLQGLERIDAIALFELRKAYAAQEDIFQAHHLTNGHALWIDLMAAQVAKGRAKLRELLEAVREESAELPEPTLASIWNTLPDREKIVLQALAETLRPTTELQLANILDPRLRYNQMARALKSLRDSNLIVIRPLENDEPGLELHPLIRSFIRTTFPITDRLSFIEAILTSYGLFIIPHARRKRPEATIQTSDQWIEGAELSINAREYKNALELLVEVSIIVRFSKAPGEFIRTCRLLLERASIDALVSINGFEKMFDTYIAVLSNTGRYKEADQSLALYESSLKGKDARYIHLCAMRCETYWIRQDFALAIRWGEEGDALKTSSGVDTQFSSAHYLALARRDVGAIDQALAFFVKNEKTEDIVNPSKFDERRDGAFYGNIGRCFQLMGQIDTALICYRKSAYILDATNAEPNVENQAFIRQWIGELLSIKNESRPSLLFCLAAKAKWTLISPPRAERLDKFIHETFIDAKDVLFSPAVERYCVEWIRSYKPLS